jgi:hypothetical protein
MWKVCSEGQSWSKQSDNTVSCSGNGKRVQWKEALELVNNHTFPAIDGYSDWRLPNIKELASLVALDRDNPSINSTIFPNTPSSSFSSSSPSPDARCCGIHKGKKEESWIIEFDYGFYEDRDRDNSYFVRLVRLGR